MYPNKISFAEWKVMNVLWEKPNINARAVVDEMKALENWNKNTTYTVLNRLVQKELIKREEPNFICITLVSRDDVTYTEAVSFLDKLYNGSLKMMVSSFLNKEKLSPDELEELRNLIDSQKDKK